MILIPVIALFAQKKNPLKELGLFSNGIKKDTKDILILFAALVAASFALSFVVQLFYQNDLGKVYERVNEIRQESAFLLGYLLIVRVFSEEVFFRGFLVKRVGPVWSSVLFGLAHVFYGSVVEVIGALVLGFILAKAFEANKSLVPNIGAHFLYNLLNVLLI